MSARFRIDVQTATTGFTILAAVGLGLWLILSTVARPAHLSDRLAKIDQRQSEAARLAASASGPLNHAAGAACHQPADVAVAALKQRLQAAASAGGLTVTNLTAAPGAADEALAGLSPVTFQVEASGHYDAAILMIAALGKGQPELFLDQADLKSQTSSVTLKLSGRLYCLTAAPL